MLGRFFAEWIRLLAWGDVMVDRAARLLGAVILGVVAYSTWDQRVSIAVASQKAVYFDQRTTLGFLLIVLVLLIYVPFTLGTAIQKTRLWSSRRCLARKLAELSQEARGYLSEATPWETIRHWTDQARDLLKKSPDPYLLGIFDASAGHIDFPTEDITNADHRRKWYHVQHRRTRIAEIIKELTK